MEWTKAKNILIVALILTNLVLIFAYAYQDNLFENSEKQVQNETVQLLKSKNIFLQTEIPDRHEPMATLYVEYDTMDQELVNKKMEEFIPARGVLSKKELIDMTSDFIDECGLFTENVTFSSIQKKDKTYKVIFKNYIKHTAIEDSAMICTVKNGTITDFERYWLQPVGFGKTEKDIIPADAALLKFMGENSNDQKIEIEDISLVYRLDSNSFNAEAPVSDTAFPAWKITYNHGEVEYIWAYEQ